MANGTVLEAIRSEVSVDRHQGGANYLYADGRVVWIAEETIADWCARRLVFVKPEVAAEAVELFP
jgi:prepilin-type processing-associated H-X9-DG protein